MTTMKISFFVTEIWREKCKIQIFHAIFLNKDISIIIAEIILKLYMSLLHILLGGSVSQIFDFGPSLYFMQS